MVVSHQVSPTIVITVKPVLSGHSNRTPILAFNTDYPLMQVKSITEWKHSAIISTFIKLTFSNKTYVLSILSGCLRQVLLYMGLNLGKTCLQSS